ncbi:hypothetical protein FYM77_07500, partial [Lactobacillus salivarius]|nr:hypothetical protein [Ligilactobacillus salivarius]
MERKTHYKMYKAG